MPKPCLGRVDLENYHAGATKVVSQSFFYTASEWIQSGLFKTLSYDGLIATTGMNLFKGSLYDFDCVTHDFLRQYVPIRTWFEEP